MSVHFIIAADGGTFIVTGGGSIITAGGSRLRIPEPPLRGTNISRFLICVGRVFCNGMLFQEGQEDEGFKINRYFTKINEDKGNTNSKTKTL